MGDTSVKIFPLGDTALTVEFGKTISVDLNKRAIALSVLFQDSPFDGFIESVPAYASTTIFYDLVLVRRSYPEFRTAFDAVQSFVLDGIMSFQDSREKLVLTIEIPVHFDQESGLDLEYVANTNGLTPEKVIELFTAQAYRVYMLGFLPGFSYMGEVNDLIATPRKDSPRQSVPKGSVGIAGKQTGIYSLNSPGGWQIIGRTDLEIFTPGSESPSLLNPGDIVKFVVA